MFDANANAGVVLVTDVETVVDAELLVDVLEVNELTLVVDDDAEEVEADPHKGIKRGIMFQGSLRGAVGDSWRRRVVKKSRLRDVKKRLKCEVTHRDKKVVKVRSKQVAELHIPTKLKPDWKPPWDRIPGFSTPISQVY